MRAIFLLFVEPYGMPWQKGFRKTHLPKPDESQSHDQRLAQRAVQQWHRKQRYIKRGQPLLYETEHTNLRKFYNENMYGLLIDLRSTADHAMHGSGTRLVNTTDGVQLEIERDAKDAAKVNCRVFVISASQLT